MWFMAFVAINLVAASAPVLAQQFDCNGGKLVIDVNGTRCEPLSNADKAQKEIDEKVWADGAEQRARDKAARAARTPEALEKKIEELKAQIDALKK